MMLRKELQKEFDKLNEELLKENITNDSLIINQSKEEVLACFIRIQEFIHLNLFNKESSTQGLIATIQLNLLESSNILLKHNVKIFSNYESNPILLAFVAQNQFLIDFLKFNFSKKFQFSFIAPYAYQLYYLPNILAQVYNSLEELANYSVDPVLIKLIKDHYISMSYSFQTLTFEKINVAQLLLEGLNEINAQEQDCQEKLLTQLIKWNFNISPFIEYCIGEIVHLKVGESNIITSFDWDLALLKTSASVNFDINQPNLKVVLKEALAEASKRRLLEKSDSFHLNEPANFYFNVKLTLNQLLFFFQVFHETGMLQSKNRTGIYQFIAKHIGTEKHQNISIGSMQRKFGRASKLEMKKVRELLIAMLNNINFKHLNS